MAGTLYSEVDGVRTTLRKQEVKAAYMSGALVTYVRTDKIIMSAVKALDTGEPILFFRLDSGVVNTADTEAKLEAIYAEFDQAIGALK